MQRKKLLNFRLPFALALSLGLGIAFSLVIIYYTSQFLYLITAVPCAAVIFIAAAIASRTPESLTYCIMTAITFLLGVTVCALAVYGYCKTEINEETVYTVSGRIEEICTSGNGTSYFIISGVKAGSVNLLGKVKVYLPEGSGAYGGVGYRISFSGNLTACDLFPYGNLASNASDNVRYYTTVISNYQAEYGFSLFGTVRSLIYGVLSDNAEPETAAVAYAMLTGNTNAVNEQTLQSFRYGGIAHIFAVSGLHIGVLYGALSFLFSRIRANKYLSAFLKIVFLVLYAGVCGFTPSSVRATVMFAVMAVSSLSYKKYDNLNALSVAVIIILLINPFYLFDAGFVMSVSAVLGIIFLAPNLKRLLRRLPGFISSALSVSLSAQFATAPALLLYFGYISGAGLILNVIVLPVLTVLYVVLIVGVIFSAIIHSAACFVIPFVTKPLEIFINFFVDARFENALISGLACRLLPVYFAAAALILSDKINLKRKVRIAVSSVAAIAFTATSVVGSVCLAKSAQVIVSGYYGGGIVIIKTGQGSALIVTEGYLPYRLESALNTYNASDVSSLILIGGDECLQTYFTLNRDFSDVYVYEGSVRINLTGAAEVHYETSFSLYGVDYVFCDGFSVSASVNGVNVGICAGEFIPVQNADLLVSVYPDTQDVSPVHAYFSLEGYEFNIYDCGDLIFNAEGGKLKKIGLTPLRK